MNAPAMPLGNLWLAVPEIALAAGICLVLMADVFVGSRRSVTATLTLLLLVITAWLTLHYGAVHEHTLLFGGLYVADPLALILKLTAMLAVALALYYSEAYLRRHQMHGGEYHVLALTALLGIFVLASSNNLLTVYLGVELLSLSLYALVAFNRESGLSAEAAMKYFVLGAIASGVLLYGMSLVYGMTGSLDLDRLMSANSLTSTGVLVGVTLIVVAVAFKFGAVPFHMWVPDVYQGAPAAVSLFIATAPKLASFALAFRLLAHGLAGDSANWSQMLAVLSVLSLAIGNLLAIAQTNFRRMLAYSAIGNVGFMLAGFVAASPAGYRAALAYTLVYVLTTLAAFAVVLLAAQREREGDDLADYKGLAQRDPLLAGCLLVTMFSTAGVPIFAGFWVKLWVIQALLDAQLLWLAVVAVVASVIGAYYYLRVIWYVYFENGARGEHADNERTSRWVLALNVLAIAAIGLLPNALLSLCTNLIR